MSKLLTTLAVVSVVLIGGCNEKTDTNELILGVPSGTISTAPQQKGGNLAVVNLGVAGNFVILAKSGITTTGTTLITGDIGVSAIAATAMTGFDLSLDASGTFSTSTLVTGKVYAADYADPTPATMTTAVSDMLLAYSDAAGRAPDVTELGAGNIGGRTLAPGVYKWSSGLLIPTDVTLAGGPNAVWIFQVAGTLTMSSDVKIILKGGAQAKNIFWQVADVVALEERSHFEGIILGMTAITLNTGATINGRMLAQSNVTLIANTVTNTESKKECEGFLNAEKKAFDDGQKTAKNLFDDGQKTAKNLFDDGQKGDKKVFDDGQKGDKKVFDDGQKDEKNIFELTNPTSVDKKVFDVAQKTAKDTFDVAQKTAKDTFDVAQKTAKNTFDVTQNTAKNTFDVTQNTAKLAFAAQQKIDAEKCKTLS